MRGSVSIAGWSCRLLLVLLTTLAWRSAPAASAPQFHHSAWSMRDGAPADIWAITQNRDGFLWLGTGSGLYRFDGVRFEHLDSTDRQLPSSNITALLATPAGDLWIGLFVGGVGLLHDGQVHAYGANDGAPTDSVYRFARDDSGAIWAASRLSLSRFDGQRWQQIGSDWGYPGGAAYWVQVDARGTLWVTTGKELLYLRKGETRFRSSGVPTTFWSVLAEAADGTIWLSDGLHGTRALPGVIAGGPADAHPVQRPPTRDLESARLHIDRSGTLWGSDRWHGGIYWLGHSETLADGRSLAERSVTRFEKKDGLSSNISVPIFEDREGSIWVGTNLGLHRFRYNNVLVPDGGQPLRNGSTVVNSPAHGILISGEHEIFRYDSDTAVSLAPVDEPRGASGFVADALGNVWIAGPQGVSRLQPGESRPVGLRGIGNVSVSVMAADDAGGLWTADNQNRLSHYDGHGWSAWRGSSALPAEPASSMLRDRRGVLWLGYSRGRLARIEGQKLSWFAPGKDSPLGAITAIYEWDGALLVGGENGMALLRGSHMQRLAILPADILDGVTGIVATDQGEVWFNGIKGVLRVARDQLRAAATDPQHALAYQIFGVDDGLPGVARQSPSNSTATIDDQGRLWFATNQGLALIDPRHLRHNEQLPPVSIGAVVSAGARYVAADDITLPERSTDLRIDYTATSLAIPDRVRFRYQLSGVDAGWQDAADRRQAFYSNLRPGRYRFRVIAANDAGVWNDAGAALTITILPTWWQTAWFETLYALAAAALLYLAYWMRLRQVAGRLRARMEERHKERERIARELHDTLLQGIHGLVLSFQAAFDRMPPQDPARPAMERALIRADRVIAEGRDRVMDLRTPASAAEQSLPEAFGQVGRDLAAQSPKAGCRR
jgi:ligand-binding sensor domain-containing protein